MSLLESIRDLTAHLHDGGVLEVTNAVFEALLSELRTPRAHPNVNEVSLAVGGGWLVVRRKPC